MTDFEHRHALQQGHEIAASDSYFEARPQIDTNDRRKVFQAGFERGWDRHAALVEAQQPTTHVQNPAEIAHVAGDVSKNGPESNMAQQPAPSAAAFDEHGFRDWVMRNLPKGSIIGNGEWWADHLTSWAKRFVKAAPQPSPTPQTDSQPAPVEVAYAMADSQYLAGVSAGWNAANADDPNAALQKLHESRAGYLKPLSAARAPADSGAAPAGGATGKNLLQVQAWVIPDGNGGGQFSWQKQDERFSIRLTPPAQAADSVLEDAARYRHLRDCNSGSLVVMQITGMGEHDWHVLTEDDADAAIDAARKQGGA